MNFWLQVSLGVLWTALVFLVGRRSAGTSQVTNEKKVLLVAIGIVTAFTTDQTVLACLNEPAVIAQMHPFQWFVLGVRCLLAGLIVWKAFTSSPDGNGNSLPRAHP